MEKLLLTRHEAAQVLNISVDTLDELRNNGKYAASGSGRGYTFRLTN